jgi:hypothetical protein
MQIPSPGIPANSSFEWWLIGVSVIGTGAVFKWLTATLNVKDDALQKAHQKATEVLVEHVVETRKLSAAITSLAENVQESIAAHIQESKAIAVEMQRASDLKEQQIAVLIEKVELLKQILAKKDNAAAVLAAANC